VLEVEERYIDPIKSTEYFKQRLCPYFKTIDDPSAFESIETICKASGDSYDLVVNCTYNMLNPIQFDHYEMFVTLLYKINAPQTFAYTIMDGPFFSIYPYDIDNNIYTVTSVIHGVAYSGLSTNYTLSSKHLETIVQNMDTQISEYIPEWKSVVQYESYYTSWKTKHYTKTDDRSLKHLYKDGVLNLYGGKITGIFDAEKIVLSILKV
jgi:enamine deaminase RidA (YjgF/YER057c/UK114 family)